MLTSTLTQYIQLTSMIWSDYKVPPSRSRNILLEGQYARHIAATPPRSQESAHRPPRSY